MFIEGATNNDGLYWITSTGKTLLVNTSDNKTKMSHEEYAYKKWGLSLEDVLKKGYIRIQSIIPQYLYIDHRMKTVKVIQEESLQGFFTENHKQIVVERKNNDIREFNSDQSKEAFRFALDGNYEGPPSLASQNVGANNAVRAMDLALVSPAYRRPGVSPFGDSVLHFSNWLNEHAKGEVLANT